MASFLEVSTPNPACTSIRPRTYLIPHPAHPLSFDRPNQPSGLFCYMQRVNTSHHNKSSLSFLCSRRPQGTRKGCIINDDNQLRTTECNVCKNDICYTIRTVNTSEQLRSDSRKGHGIYVLTPTRSALGRPASPLFNWNWVISFGSKSAGAEDLPLTEFGAEVKNECSHTSNPHTYS